MTSSSVSLVRLTLSHLSLDERDGLPSGAVGRDDAGRAFFAPGRIPCGLCRTCMRGLCAACPGLRALAIPPLAGEPPVPPIVEVPDRFLSPLDEPPGSTSVPPEQAAAAGLVAEPLEWSARAGAGPGDTTLWIGSGALARCGASLSASRGGRSFRLGSKAGQDSPGVGVLDPASGPAAWRASLEAAEGVAGGVPERRILVCGPSPTLMTAAFDLATPGSTVVLLAPRDSATVGRVALVSFARLLVGGGYHPDLVPEALAACRRGDVQLPSLLRAWPPSDAGPAVAAGDAAIEPRMAVIDFTRAPARPARL